MKYGLILMIGLVTAGLAQGQLLLLGTQELGIEGTIDFDTPGKTALDMNVSYGYFLFDYIEIKGDFSLYDDDFATAVGLLVSGEYNIDLGIELVPFVGGGIGLGRLKYQVYQVTVDEEGEGEVGRIRNKEKNSVLLGVSGGLKYFLAENLALSVALNGRVASEKIFPGKDKMSRTDLSLDWGLRFFF
ncbi:MAG: hypothetical protein K9N49_04255 [Candidatus Marinimicrobia bacterium]|nr:hypothetical protein [Candidatus Neomarinimicrobiota bacterium]